MVVVGGIYSPNHQTNRWGWATVDGRTRQSGVPVEQRLQHNGRLQRKPEKRYSAQTVHAESEQAPEGAPDSEQ